jgi:hemerythrin-like domain-containing protein
MPCDPFEMALVHRGFRRELGNATDLVRGVAPGDTRRAGVVCEHIDFMLTAVHFHHSAEDKIVWPRLTSRAPSRTEEWTRMEDAHRTIDDAAERVRATAIAWTQAGDLWRAEELVSEIARFVPLVDDHFDDEENNVVPLIAEYLSPKEWQRFLSHGSAFVRAHPRRGLALGGIVLDGESAETRDRFLGNLPLPLRTIFKTIGDRVYAGYRAQVYGSSSSGSAR